MAKAMLSRKLFEQLVYFIRELDIELVKLTGTYMSAHST